MDKRALLDRLAGSGEERLLYARVLDKLQQAEQRNGGDPADRTAQHRPESMLLACRTSQHQNHAGRRQYPPAGHGVLPRSSPRSWRRTARQRQSSAACW